MATGRWACNRSNSPLFVARFETSVPSPREIFDVAALSVEKPRSERAVRLTPDDTPGTSSAARPTTRERDTKCEEARRQVEFYTICEIFEVSRVSAFRGRI